MMKEEHPTANAEGQGWDVLDAHSFKRIIGDEPSPLFCHENSGQGFRRVSA
jgi:hypothetical protein